MHRVTLSAFGFFLTLLCSSHAVHVMGTTGNTTAPVDDPGFANVGAVNGASAIYLGNRWVLTASHVGAGSVVLGGNTYTVSGPVTQLTNMGTPGMSANTDMVLFQINTDPGLPALSIAAGSPAAGQSLVMIGNGANRNASRSYYTVVQGPNPGDDVWTSAGGPGPGVIPMFEGSGGSAIRWGTNNVEAVNINASAGFGTVKSFFTFFNDDPIGRPDEAQGVLGDSGSAVFRKNGATWELLGMTHAVSTASGYDNIPGFPSTSLPGESTTYMADLSFYRNQILSIIPEPGSAALAGIAVLGLLRRRRD